MCCSKEAINICVQHLTTSFQSFDFSPMCLIFIDRNIQFYLIPTMLARAEDKKKKIIIVIIIIRITQWCSRKMLRSLTLMQEKNLRYPQVHFILSIT